MLLLPAQLHRQAPQRGTAARPRQSLYQPTGWTSPSRGITIVLARTTGGAATGRTAGGAGRTGFAAATAAACWLAANARAWAASAAALAAAAWAATIRSRCTWRTRRWSSASALTRATPWAYAGWLTAAGCHIKRGKLRSQIATPPTSGPRQRRRRLAMGRATRARRPGLRGLHDRHRSVEYRHERHHLRILDRLTLSCWPWRAAN